MLHWCYLCVGRLWFYFFFFFSSRRRHTRCLSDWSSDVCSSDLGCCAWCRPNRGDCRGRGKRHDWAGTKRSSRCGARHAEERRKIGRASCRERVQVQWGAGQVREKTVEITRTQTRKNRDYDSSAL